MENKKTQINVRVTPELYDKIKELAKRKENGISAIVRMALSEYIKKELL